MNYILELCSIFKKKNRQIKFFSSLVLIIFFLLPSTTNASHIVGGEISYSCLGGSTYEVRLTVYRDCFNAIPSAIFDPIASIGIFDANHNLVTSLNGLDSGQILIPQTVDDTLEILLTDPCLFPPTNVCVNSMTYVDTVVLPPISGGYQLVYQRCCRNVAISNIINPFYVGASFVVNISEAALLGCNSSPEFQSQPPVFLCVNEPFVFDQSVMDIDGDSLVYRLCTPFDGASFDEARPQPPNPPPYDEINWLNPPYTLDNLLGGIPLEVDAETGMMTGTPNTQGIFLVGMCIEEYRNGVLISETRREFQYNVGVCSNLTASFETPNLQCEEDLEVDFENTSINSGEYLWVFNDPNNPNATSTEISPSFTFSDTGSYTIMLIANPNGICTDTSYMDIFLEKSAMEAAFSYVTLDCTDSVQLALVDMSIDSVHAVESWFWELSDGQSSTEQYPLFVVDSSQSLLVTLTVWSSNGCKEEAQHTIPINLIPSNLLPSEITICEGDVVQLNPNPPIGLPFNYAWSPDDGLSANNIPSPFASPEENTTYTLVISDLVNDCFAELEVDIIVLENPSLSINQTDRCSSEIILTASTDLTQADFSWATDIGFNSVVSDSSSLTVTPTPDGITYYAQITSSGSCVVMDSIFITEQGLDIELVNSSQSICVGDIAQFSVMNNDPNDELFFTWFVGNTFLTDSILEIIPTQAGTSVFYIQVENQYGCTHLDSVFLEVLAPSSLEIETNFDCDGNTDETILTANTNLTQVDILWATDIDFNNIISDSSMLTVTPTADGITYYVQVSSSSSCVVMDSIFVIEQGLDIELNNNSQFICVGDTAIFSVMNNDPNDELSFTWFVGNTLLTDSILEIIPTEAGTDIFYIQVENQYGCTYSDSVLLNVLDPAPPLEIETGFACDNNIVSLSNLSLNANYYHWIITLPTGNDTIMGAIINYDFPSVGIYNVTLESIAGLPCALPSESFEIEIHENLVTANFEWEYVECENGLTIQFTDMSSAVQGNVTTWFWNFENNLSSTDQNPILELNANQEIEVELIVLTNQGCTATYAQTIDFSTIDIGIFQAQAIICNGNSIVLNPLGNPSLTYEWSPASFLNDATAVSPIASPPVNTLFSVTITDPDNQGCEVIKTVGVNIPDEPVVAAFDYNVINCGAGGITLSFVDMSTPTASINNWFWSFSNGQTSNGQNTIIVAEPGVSLIIQFQVQTEEGCTDIVTDTIEVESFTFDLPQNEIIKCSGVPVNLNPGGNPNYTYEWSPAATLNNADAVNPIANPTETTQYCVMVTNGDCTEETCVMVIVPDVPLAADFSYNVGGCVNEATILFQDESLYSLGNIETWNWTFSDGSISVLENPILTVEQSTTIEATLEVTTADGCEASFSQEIEINFIEINIPNQVVLCDGAPVQLNQGGNPNHTYSWSPSSGLTDNDIASPVAFPVNTTTYTVVINDGDCEVVQTVQVVVPDTPLAASFSYVIDDCTDIAVIDFQDESNYSPGGVVEWDWQFSNGDSSDIANPNITITQSQTLQVTLTVVTNDGCIETTSQSIEVDLIDINISSSVVNCGGMGIELNAGGDPTYDYIWSPATGLSNPTSTNPIANPMATTIYSVSISDGPCELVRTVEVVVTDEVEAGFSFVFDDCTDNAIIEFTDTTLFSNTTITSWDWIFIGNNTFVSDLQNPVLILDESQTIVAELTVTTAEGCTSTTTQNIEVDLVDINIPASVFYCNDQTIILNPDGNPDYEYSWSPSAGLSATNIASPLVSNLTQNTSYSVTVTYGNCTLTRLIEILVPDTPLQADVDISYVNCIDTAVVQFMDASTSMGGIIEWEWLVNSQLSTDQNPVYTFSQNQPANVRLIVTSANGCRDTINTSFDISIMNNIQIPTDVASCNGSGVFLNPNSNPAYSYEWSPSTGLSDASSANPFATPSTSMIYTVSITNSNNDCVEERMVSYNIPTIPLTAGFEWELVACADTAVVEFTDTSLYSGIISEWDWSIDNGFMDTIQNTSFVFSNADTVNIQLIVQSNDGCIDSITQEVIVEVIQIDFLEDTIQLCDADTTYLNPNGNPDLFYNWSPAATVDSSGVFNPLATPLGTTQYVVTITSPNNVVCHEVRTVDVIMPTQPISLDWNYPNDTTICSPTMQLVAESNAIEYLWSDHPDFQNVLSTDIDFTAVPNNSATYYVQVRDDAGCTIVDSIEITSYAILASLENEITLCYGDSVELEVELSPLSVSQNLEYTWMPDTGIVLNNNSSTPVLSPEDSTEYTLLIENQFGCEYMDTIQMNILNLGNLVELSVDKDSINAGDAVQLFATESSDWTYEWTPCEVLDGCEYFNPIAAIEETTLFTVAVEETVLGCRYVDSVLVYVFDESRCREPYVFVPKGFTPNGDGLNDILYVRGNYIEEMHFVLFNRWGEKVFETKDLDEGWDGTINGKALPPDVFGYYVTLKCFGGEEYLMRGNVTLIR